MRKKQVLLVMMAVFLLLPSFLVKADSTERVNAETVEGKLSSKDEVVYATLHATGALEEIYVVNTLDVAKAGEIFDYGVYTSLKNLTDLSELTQESQNVRINAPEGKFYYQGNMNKDTELPWEISISYLLDRQKIAPAELAGQNGHLEIIIKTSANNAVDKVFYENYLLQVSLQLPNNYENIVASGGMVANAGKNKQITFTVMPGENEEFSVEADVENFEFQGVDIAAIPSTLPIDTSEMGNMTDAMATLSNAIRDVNNGVAELEDGVIQLNNGVSSLRDGSAQYRNGMNEIDGASTKIVTASNSIGDALKTISTSLTSNSEEMDLTKLAELPAGLTQLAKGLTDTANGLTKLQESYSQAYSALDSAIAGVPEQQVSDEEIAGLYASGANKGVLDRLLAFYGAAQKIKATYSVTKEAFEAVEPSLTKTSGALKEMSGSLTFTANELSTSLEDMDLSALGELQKGIATLSANYREFHTGLVSYTDGVSTLTDSYNDLHSGIVDLSDGTDELANGVGKLHDGTNELYEETKDLPEQMEDEINQTISEYDKSDFQPVSFVSPKNKDVYSVQFVIKTGAIKKEEQETKKAKTQEEKGFWDLLMDLFK
ncbi:YhgE/Pip domain-containing protein [Fredinandcohnia sp. 179-A 10B2 NHS]|uniref:YhgE/Pip domain-containing protein n=1 Tax=Fredinandcohnia sp. 179-A 10B2 NHS TaxID=3235176 RepID=UPI0039A1F465